MIQSTCWTTAASASAVRSIGCNGAGVGVAAGRCSEPREASHPSPSANRVTAQGLRVWRAQRLPAFAATARGERHRPHRMPGNRRHRNGWKALRHGQTGEPALGRVRAFASTHWRRTPGRGASVCRDRDSMPWCCRAASCSTPSGLLGNGRSDPRLAANHLGRTRPVGAKP
jgi:hypothetical protein